MSALSDRANAQKKGHQMAAVLLFPKAQFLQIPCNSAMWSPAGTPVALVSPTWSTRASAALCATPRSPGGSLDTVGSSQTPRLPPSSPTMPGAPALPDCNRSAPERVLVPTLLRTSHFPRWLSGATKEPSEVGAKQKRGFKQELSKSICADIHQCHSLAAKAIFINHVSKLATNLYKETDGLVVAVCHH